MIDGAVGHGTMTGIVVAIFATVYVGMFLSGLPRLKLDRAGVALLGAIGSQLLLSGLHDRQLRRSGFMN